MRRACAALLLASCASSTDDFLDERRNRAADAHEHNTQGAVAPTVVPPKAKPPPPPDPETVAYGLADDLECSRAVSRLDGEGRGDEAWGLLLACSHQGKWRNLNRVLSPPWHGRLRAMSEADAFSVLAEVIANRGGTFEADLPAVQKMRWSLLGLEDAFTSTGLPVNTWIVFRGKITSDVIDKSGRRVLEIVEMVRSTQDRKGLVEQYDSRQRYLGTTMAKVGSHDLFLEGSTRVHATWRRDARVPVGSEQLIMLARVAGAGEDRDGKRLARVELVSAYVPGTITFDVSH